MFRIRNPMMSSASISKVMAFSIPTPHTSKSEYSAIKTVSSSQMPLMVSQVSSLTEVLTHSSTDSSLEVKAQSSNVLSSMM